MDRSFKSTAPLLTVRSGPLSTTSRGNSTGRTVVSFVGTSSAAKALSPTAADFEYVVKDKNTILILQIIPKHFSEAIWNARYFTLVMPDNLQNLSLSFESKGSSMLTALADCVKKNEKKYQDFKPSLEKVPDLVKERL